MSDKKIVIKKYDMIVCAKLYENDNLIKEAFSKCGSDFESAAMVAVSKLTDSFDWKAFETGTISVKVTKDKFKEFVAEAKKRGFTFKPDENFNPFGEMETMIRMILSLASDSPLRSDEIYITYDVDRLKVHFVPEGREEVVW